MLLVVIDTLRADAVSAYGAVRGTTPQVDALAEQGLRYTHAYAPAPWTIPSHVSLFTGLGVEHHHVGMSERITAGPELVMLAERLRDAGYETAGFAENPLIGEPFGMNQGFEHFSARTLEQLLAEFRQPGSSGYDVARAVESWARGRDPHRPFFVFVNLFEPHEPYRVREVNRFLPPGTTAADGGRRCSSPRAASAIALPSSEELAILRGLYLGDVAAADATLGEIVAPGPRRGGPAPAGDRRHRRPRRASRRAPAARSSVHGRRRRAAHPARRDRARRCRARRHRYPRLAHRRDGIGAAVDRRRHRDQRSTGIRCRPRRSPAPRRATC